MMIRGSILGLLLGCTVGCTVGCTPRVVYVPTPLPLPDKPELVKVSEAELACLSGDTREKLLTRDRDIKAYVGLLRAIIATSRDKP